MSASPAIWTARAILASALAVAVAYIITGPWDRPASVAPAPAPLAPRPTPPAPRPSAKPASSPTPAPYAIKRILDTGGPIRYGDWFWDEAGVPAGQTVITVDLKANVLSIFRGGYEIGTSAVIYGADEVPTPLGVYPVIGKDADHVSNLYNAPMPYMLRLTNDGISIHGSKVAYDAATHGCIGVPTPFAKKLFAAVKLGDKVIITRGEQLAQGAPIKAL